MNIPLYMYNMWFRHGYDKLQIHTNILISILFMIYATYKSINITQSKTASFFAINVSFAPIDVKSDFECYPW